MTKHIIFVLFALLAGGLLWWLLVPQGKKKEKAHSSDDHSHGHNNEHGHSHDEHKKGGWLETIVCIIAGLAIILLVLLGHYRSAVALAFAVLAYFCWGKEIPLAGKVMWILSFFVAGAMFWHYSKEKKEGVTATVSHELRSFNSGDLESRYGRPVEWLWEIQVFRNGRLATDRSSKDVKCIEWTASTLVVQVPLGGNTKTELRWNDLFGGDTLIQGYTERTRGGFNLQPSDVPGPEVSKEYSQPTLFEGTLELPIKSITGPKETLSFRLRPQVSYEALLKGWIPGAKKL